MRKHTGALAVTAGLSLVLLQACVQATFVPTGAMGPPREADCDIQVFSASTPDRPYEEMGIVEGEGDWWKADLEDILPRLKEEACLAGGDALIMQSTNTFAEGSEGVRVQRITATVIRWTSGGERRR